MKRANHTIEGLAFIAACIVIAVAIYVAGRTPHAAAPTQNIAMAQPTAEPIDVASADEVSTPGAPTATGAPPPPDAERGSCNGGACSWSRTLSEQLIREGPEGRLIRVELLGGSSPNDDDAITWNTAPHSVFVFCSTRLPAVLFPDGGVVQTDILSIVEGVPTIQVSALSIYGATCHKDDNAAFMRDPEQLGYRPLPDGAEDITVSSPEDIFRVVASFGS